VLREYQVLRGVLVAFVLEELDGPVRRPRRRKRSRW
jgi:hypothetical protein